MNIKGNEKGIYTIGNFPLLGLDQTPPPTHTQEVENDFTIQDPKKALEQATRNFCRTTHNFSHTLQLSPQFIFLTLPLIDKVVAGCSDPFDQCSKKTFKINLKDCMTFLFINKLISNLDKHLSFFDYLHI